MLHRIETFGLAIAAAFPWLLVAMVLMTAALTTTSAKAQSCGGQNLLDQLKQEDPAAYKAALEKAAATPFGQHNLFKIERDGVAPSYLFGTMHLTDSRVRTLPKEAQKALDGASRIIIETTEVVDPEVAQAKLLARPDLTMFMDEKRISDFLSNDEKNLLSQGLEERGMRLALVNRMKPWLLSGLMAAPSCEMSRKKSGVEILDIAIAKQADIKNVPLDGLETIVEQLEAMASLPMDDHVNGLLEIIRLGDQMDDVFETMIQLYVRGEPGLIMPVLQALGADGTTGEASSYAAFEEAMVNKRNNTMLNRSLEFLDQGGAFIAVGALHLPGENGLANLFEKAGYKVTPVDNQM